MGLERFLVLPLLDVLVVDAEDNAARETDSFPLVVTMTGGGDMLDAAAE